jgi:cytochrome c556
MNKSKLLVGLSVAAGVAVLASGVSVAQDAIAARKAYMKAVGAAAKASNEMIKGEKPYDAKAAAEHMTKISSGWSTFAKNYPKGTETGGETTASPKIWENFQDFDAKGIAMAAAAKKAGDGAAGGLDAFKAGWAEVGKTCKGCHEVYRVQKK